MSKLLYLLYGPYLLHPAGRLVLGDDVRAPHHVEEHGLAHGFSWPALTQAARLRIVRHVIADAGEVYQLKVVVAGIEPPIWRRIQVPADVTLAGLHRILQRAMGWTDSHLHEFEIKRQRYGTSSREVWGYRVVSEGGVLLYEVAGRGSRFTYTYDLGDQWEHIITVEKILPAAPGQPHAVCLDGARSCPPEDCGGVPGYDELIEVLRDPNDPEHEERLEWLGDAFDPEAFDVAAVNRKLARLKGRKRG